MESVDKSMFGVMQRPAVLVLGLGESGLAMARWCARHGCRVRVADTRANPPGLPALQALAAELRTEIEFVPGALSAALLGEHTQLLAISPGLPPLAEENAALLQAAAERGIPVWGELEFFAQALQTLGASGYEPRVLAITGTNGKTTTTALTGTLVARSGKSVAVAGNISPSLLDTLSAAIDNAALPQVWVLELSSFQLETAHSFAPHAATVLNLSQDHLDWHGSFAAYAAAKGKIFGPDTVRVVNRDDAQALALGMPAPAEGASPAVLSFGVGMPVHANDYGLDRDGGIAWLVRADDRRERAEGSGTDAEPVRRRSRTAQVQPDMAIKRLMPMDALRIRGLHNAANAMAALALCQAIGLPLAGLLHGLREYRGEPHRVELIASLNGVEYVDDSKGTNVGATVAALDGLAQRTLLIAGGEGKGQDFSPLAAPVMRWCRAVLLIGRDAPLLRAALAGAGVPMTDCVTLEEAVQRATVLAQAGDAVLLSPACASFDMFRGYAHRAEVFRQAVEQLAADQGVMI